MNYTLIIIAVIVQFALGAFWYSPLMFGKWWMQIMETEKRSEEEMKKMQKEMAPFYGLQFLMTVLFTSILAIFLHYFTGTYGIAGLIWLGFIVPTQVSGIIWGHTKKKFWAKQIFVVALNQLVGIMLAAFILTR